MEIIKCAAQLNDHLNWVQLFGFFVRSIDMCEISFSWCEHEKYEWQKPIEPNSKSKNINIKSMGEISFEQTKKRTKRANKRKKRITGFWFAFFGVFFDTWMCAFFYLGFCVFRPFFCLCECLNVLLCVWVGYIFLCAVIWLCVHTVTLAQVFGLCSCQWWLNYSKNTFKQFFECTSLPWDFLNSNKTSAVERWELCTRALI